LGYANLSSLVETDQFTVTIANTTNPNLNFAEAGTGDNYIKSSNTITMTGTGITLNAAEVAA